MSAAQMMQYALWFGAPVFQLAIVIMLWRRKLQREFPCFFVYTALQVVTFGLLFATFKLAPARYFYAYWGMETLSIVAGFAVIHEIFSQAFKPYKGLRDLGNVLYRWVMVVMFAITAVFAMTTPGGDAQQLVAWMIALERVVRVMQCGLLLFIFLLCSRLGLSWRHFVVGLALGFGTFASIELMLLTVRVQAGSSANDFVNLIKSISYNLAVLIWFAYLIPREPLRRHPAIQPHPDRWDYALLTLLQPNPPSFMSSMEETVERVLNDNGHSVHSA